MQIKKDLKSYFAMGFAPLLVFSFHVFVTTIGIYSVWRWFDTPMHFLGGCAIAISSYFFLEHIDQKHIITKSRAIEILIILAFVCLAAVMWELAEYAGDFFLGSHMQPSVYDTMKDLTMGMSGGIITGLILVNIKRRK